MDKQKLHSLLNSPRNLSKEDYEVLIELNAQYPYIQAIYPLLVLGAKKYDQNSYKKLLQSAAIYTIDRVHLKDLLKEEQVKEKSKETQAPEKKVTLLETKKPELVQTEFKDKITINKVNEKHLPDSFFNELSKEMQELQKSKLAFKAFLEQSEKEEKPVEKKSEDKAANTEKKKASTKGKTQNSKKATTKSKAESDKKATSTKKAKTEKTTKKKATPKKTIRKAIIEGEHQSLLDEIKLKEIKAIDNDHLKEQISMITSFIEKEPSINKKILNNNVDAKRAIEDLSESSTHLADDVISETLAKLMLKQGRKDKAIDIYKKLIWKFPQKKTYFADQIKNIKLEE